jgi:hypothetical protein
VHIVIGTNHVSTQLLSKINRVQTLDEVLYGVVVTKLKRFFYLFLIQSLIEK